MNKVISTLLVAVIYFLGGLRLAVVAAAISLLSMHWMAS